MITRRVALFHSEISVQAVLSVTLNFRPHLLEHPQINPTICQKVEEKRRHHTDPPHDGFISIQNT